MAILITGARGFVGKSLVKSLSEYDGKIIAVSRQPPSFSLPQNVEWVILNSDPLLFDWTPYLKRTQILVHLLAKVHDFDDSNEKEYKEINVDLPLFLANKLKEESSFKTKKIIFLSSIKVYGEEFKSILSENSPLNPQGPYARSKLEAEEKLKQLFMNDHQLTSVYLLRSPLIYGPEVKANFSKLIQLVDKVPCLPFACASSNKRSFLFIENLISAIHRIILKSQKDDEYEFKVYNICDDGSFSLKELILNISFSMNKKNWLIPIPLWIIRSLAHLLNKRDQLNKMLGSLHMDNQKIKKDLKWSPPYSFNEGISISINNMRSVHDSARTIKK